MMLEPPPPSHCIFFVCLLPKTDFSSGYLCLRRESFMARACRVEKPEASNRASYSVWISSHWRLSARALTMNWSSSHSAG
ncbi:hypothetical protein LY78DRAFT_732045 [Colletotrichum sublineola]|nr:hypothetical protein LY78DRAFT_732045 [Colletotrichum sublineola]